MPEFTQEIAKSLYESFFFTIMIAILIARIKIYYMKNIYIIAIINSIGTIFHELIHYIFGLILGARPTRFSLLPKATESGYVLGSVSFCRIAWLASTAGRPCPARFIAGRLPDRSIFLLLCPLQSRNVFRLRLCPCCDHRKCAPVHRQHQDCRIVSAIAVPMDDGCHRHRRRIPPRHGRVGNFIGPSPIRQRPRAMT